MIDMRWFAAITNQLPIKVQLVTEQPETEIRTVAVPFVEKSFFNLFSYLGQNIMITIAYLLMLNDIFAHLMAIIYPIYGLNQIIRDEKEQYRNSVRKTAKIEIPVRVFTDHLKYLTMYVHLEITTQAFRLLGVNLTYLRSFGILGLLFLLYKDPVKLRLCYRQIMYWDFSIVDGLTQLMIRLLHSK